MAPGLGEVERGTACPVFRADADPGFVSQVLFPRALFLKGLNLQARLSDAADHDVEKEVAGLREYLLRDSKVVEGGKMDAAAEAWRKI